MHFISNLPKYIELETSKLCNRKCAWCPNGENNARESQDIINWNLFLSILTQLSKLKYSGWIALHNYNEPLLNPRLSKEIKTAKEILPMSSPCVFTNGDFITLDIINELNLAGLKYLRITLYPTSKSKTESSIQQIQRWVNIKKLSSFLWQYKHVRQGESAFIDHNGTDIEIISPNLLTYNYRGNTSFAAIIEQRTKPCFMTSHSAAIDYKGRMKMCCNIYPENSSHEPYIIGDLNNETFEELWNSKQLIDLRKRHSKSDWSMSLICSKCNQYLPESQTLGYEQD